MASRVRTILVGSLGDSTIPKPQPMLLVTDAPVPMRVLVRNNGFGQTLYFAYDTSALQPRPTSDTYELPAGAADVLVVNVGESLYADTDGFGQAKLSFAISDAFPFDTRA